MPLEWHWGALKYPVRVWALAAETDRIRTRRGGVRGGYCQFDSVVLPCPRPAVLRCFGMPGTSSTEKADSPREQPAEATVSSAAVAGAVSGSLSGAESDAESAAMSAARGDGKRAYVQQMFGDIAPRYDLLNHVLSLNIDKRWRRRALKKLAWTQKPEGTYLDLCAGTLDIGAMLSAQNGFSGRVAAADFAVPMLKHGAGKAAPDVLWPVGADALALPFADQCFDGAIVGFGIRNVADLDACLVEVKRVLRPGARFVILEFSTPRSTLVRAGYLFYFHKVLPLVGRIVSGHGSAYTYLPLSVAQFPSEEVLADRMRSAGYRTVEWERLSFGIAALHVGTV